MKLLRNQDVKSLFYLQLITCILSVILCFSLPRLAVLWTAAGFLVCMLMTLLFEKKRYNDIAMLSNTINDILHGSNPVPVDDCHEGELSILRSEIYKMSAALSAQALALRNEKNYLSDSLADISHQLRTPLTSMLLIQTLLAKETLSDEERTSLCRELSSLLTRTNSLIETLLKLSKLDANTIQLDHSLIRLTELIHNAIQPLEIPLELKEIQVKLSGDASACMTGDFMWTAEALSNIIKNCMEHMPDGGTITIEYLENVIYSEILISDTGDGIDPDDLLHIFERFYHGKNATSQSFGIGLSLSRTIITKQNGTIKAENNRDIGCHFTIRFYKTVI